jgi:hypothetical protein
MDWAMLAKVGGPLILSLLKNLGTGLATDSPVGPVKEVPEGTVKVPSRAIKDLQALLNVIVKPDPLLAVDGWLGPRTEEAIEEGIAMLKKSGIG